MTQHPRVGFLEIRLLSFQNHLEYESSYPHLTGNFQKMTSMEVLSKDWVQAETKRIDLRRTLIYQMGLRKHLSIANLSLRVLAFLQGITT